MITMNKINYEGLKPKQQENYNFHKISSVLAEYGYSCVRLSDDWNGADFLALHISGGNDLKVQLKGRLAFDKKYMGKNLHVAFRDGSDWFLYPHDEVLEQLISNGIMTGTKSWEIKGNYHFPSLSPKIREIMRDYLLP